VKNISSNSASLRIISLALIVIFLFFSMPLADIKPAIAVNPQSILSWSVVETPSKYRDGNVIVNPSEINRIIFGTNDDVAYAVDIANSKLYRSINSGITWDIQTIPGANPPVWDIALAPDDTSLIVAITDSTVLPSGPKKVLVSTDGGQNWVDILPTVIPPTLKVGELISCVDISPQYATGKRYIAIATRDGAGTGRVLTYKAPGPSAWVDQTIAPSLNWIAGDIVSLKFSPSYVTDNSIVVTFASATPAPAGGLFINTGYHDIIGNRTTWKTGMGYPIKITSSDAFRFLRCRSQQPEALFPKLRCP
jgi:hypothetical protein